MSQTVNFQDVKSGIIDSHAHVLVEYFKDEQGEVIDRAFKANVRQIVNPGINLDGLAEVLSLAGRFEHIYAGVGVHPHDAKTWNDEVEAKLSEALTNPKVVAVGECGLDFFYNNSERDEQLKALKAQVELAVKFDKPLIIHCRDAWDDLVSVFDPYLGRIRGVFHCFTGDCATLELIRKFDFYISFSGIVTFPKSVELQKAAQVVPNDRLLVETDCPYLAPQAVRGKRNEPSYVWYVAEKLAQLRDVPLEEIAEHCSSNARTLFGLPSF